MDLSKFTTLELYMYSMVLFKVATMQELKEVYTLDEALNMLAFYNMQEDIKAQSLEKMQADIQRSTKR